jgi:hypothetical protein
MTRSHKSESHRPRPALPVRRCYACEYFIRELSGGPACALLQAPTKVDGTCPGWVFRQTCRVCGCSHFDPCDEGCWWVEPDLCSACAYPNRIPGIVALGRSSEP